MATVAFQAARITERTMSVTWAVLRQDDDGAAFERTDFADRSMQVWGVFGAGATLLIEGTNDPATGNWQTLTDPQGVAVSLTAARIEQVQEVTRYIRPRVVGGDGTTALTVIMLARG